MLRIERKIQRKYQGNAKVFEVNAEQNAKETPRFCEEITKQNTKETLRGLREM